MARHVVCRVEELPPGARKIVEIRGREIGVFNVNGSYYALLNRCPHRAAPLCKGPITGLIGSPKQYKFDFCRDGEIVRCPWHGWEFDITTGRSIFNPHKMRVKTYEVTIEQQRALDALPDEVETYPVTVEEGLVILHT